MQIVDGELVVSPTDLTRFLACRHLTTLDHEVALGERPAPAAPGEALEQLFRRGLEHEHAYLDRLRAEGRTVVQIDVDAGGRGPAGLRAAEESTVAAMAAGADVVYQATFYDGLWRGHADFLLRRDDRPGRWGWSYDVADTKLARRLKVPAILQMAAYAERLAVLQGVEPERLVVVTGEGQERPYRFADCAAYARRVRAELLEFLRERPGTAPYPVRHCGQCRWEQQCRSRWRAADDLSLVAGMRRHHAEALRAAGVTTVAALAAAEPAALAGPGRGRVGRTVAEKLVRQARLQVAERASGEGRWELLPAEPGRGLALLPEPSPGDVFFDMEGDPFVGDTGLEYLFGVVDAGGFTGYWAVEPEQEKAAFEALVDHLVAAWEADPGMHVYHYAPYEPSRLKALSARYETRSAEVSRLLRGERLVDLYSVVKQGVRVGQESYSLKRLEPYYWGHLRGGEGVHDALGSVVAFERWLLERDDAVLEEIRAYNEEDCRSTQALRDWLEGLRASGPAAALARPGHGDGAAPEQVDVDADETARLRETLWAGLPDDPAARSPQQRATWLLGALLEWHRREALPQWWDWFDRLHRTDAELQADPAALGALSAPEQVGTVKRSTLWRMEFPPQETKVAPRSSGWVDPRSGRTVRVHDVDPVAGWVVLARGSGEPAPELTALVPGKPFGSKEQRARLHELARWVAAHGVDSPLPQWRAARDLLLRRPPRVAATAGGPLVAPGESASDAVRRLVALLAADADGGVLPVQGPPGTGKTYSGAQVVVDLVAAGLTVGVCAFSHKVIGNLLDETCRVAAGRGVTLDALQKADDDEACESEAVPSTTKNSDVVAALDAGARLVAGTTWLFSRPELAGRFDVLVVDEAGQLSLANVLAVSGAARSLLLLGDPQQLTQPVQGTHPPGAEASALEHLLAGAATVPPGRGVLLDETYRMHPSVAGFVSGLAYDGRLGVAPGRERQHVLGAAGLTGTGLRWVPVPHRGNAAVSPEEAHVVAGLVAGLLGGGMWRDADDRLRPLTPDEVLVLTPYNQHAQRVRQALASVPRGDEVLVGTVDKLQGRQAAAVVYSLATSSAEQAPRGLEFLLSVNRFTVAVSRARALVAVVGSPDLLLAPVGGPADLRRLNALCAYVEQAQRLDLVAVGRQASSMPPATSGAPGSVPAPPTDSRAR
ncbi:TM0106 family RecB-like putative nuclease [Kineosporia sp. A_224]|uniref:TM0106 family RecB-like putative nuclease n=1 Tax=Kineosporia sp. A_224 TaxID=1962180 RepID=UPI000B4AECB4|nr:TM0106 family RecB-like putative nuclease [Kineosporia sp. A_224]